MKSVADGLRRDATEALSTLSPSARIELALRLGDEDVAIYAAARRITEAEGRAALRRTRRIGRVPSRSHDGGDE